MSEQDEMASGQAHAEALIARLESDPSFAERAQSDPRGALAEIGVPEGQIDALVTTLEPEADVAGFAARRANLYLKGWANVNQMTLGGMVSLGCTTVNGTPNVGGFGGSQCSA